MSCQHPEPETSLDPLRTEPDIQKNYPLETMSFQVFPASWVTPLYACRMEEAWLGHQVWSCVIAGIHVI